MKPPSRRRQRAVVDERRFERAADVGAEVEPRFELLQQRASRGRSASPSASASSASVRPTNARSRGLARPVVDAGEQPLQVVDLPRALRGARPASAASATSSATASSRASIAATSVSGLASQSASSRAPIGVTVRSIDAQQRALAAAVADRARDLQAAARGLVDLQRLAAAIRHQPVDVVERRLLRLAQIVEHRAGGPQGRATSLVVEAEAFERGVPKVLVRASSTAAVQAERPGRPAA